MLYASAVDVTVPWLARTRRGEHDGGLGMAIDRLYEHLLVLRLQVLDGFQADDKIVPAAQVER